MRSGGNARGFTLLELLVVTAILAIVVAAIAASFGAGLRAWDAARAFGTEDSDLALALDQMSRDLSGTFSSSVIPFMGKGGSLSFPGLVAPASDGRFRMGTITYRYDRQRRALVRGTRIYPDGAEGEERMVACDGFSVDSFAGDSGTVTGGPPARVEVVIMMPVEGGGAGVRRTFWVPAGESQ